MDPISECREMNRERIVERLFRKEYPAAKKVYVNHVGDMFALAIQEYDVRDALFKESARNSVSYRFTNPLEDEPIKMHVQERKGTILKKWVDVPRNLMDEILRDFEAVRFYGRNVIFG